RVTEYRYDGQHRLVGVTTADGRSASYRYDAFGRRISKTVDGKTTEFFWQGDHLIAESSREHYRSYVYEPGTFRPLAMLDGKGPDQACPFYYQLDHLGTPQELTDYSGDIVWSATYNAYGQLTRLVFGGGEQLEQPLRFQGQYFDAESGLHYNRHRYYDPEVGRYLTPDPIKLAGGLNQYQYTRNPTGWVDPLGLSGSCPPPNKLGCGAPDDTTGARVDEGEPALPKPKLSAAELAKKEVKRLNDSQGMHMVGKHSPAVPDAKWKQRAIDGTDPITGRRPRHQRGNPSSRFSSWELMLEAYTLATTRTERGLSRFTGKDGEDNNIVRMRLPGAGEGYIPNTRSKENPRLIKLDGFEMKFDDAGVPFTLYPIK
ncbi:RHS repeat domain-containing protein, partial [Pseudomonas sp. ES4]|uniref:RHS repeat domain-containing protein n=1 Tax=Pseudomonas sp. ES4 TaxID=3424777 RepID=UPI003D334E7E